MPVVLPTHRSVRRARAALAGAALAALVGLTGCAGAPAEPAPDAAAAQQDTPVDHSAPAGTHGGHHGSDTGGLYAVQTGPLGVIATDGQGHILYRSDSDSNQPPTSTCVDACADTWLPVIVPDGVEQEYLGVSPELVGTIPRADGGQQMTLAGWPLYRRADDDGLLTSTGHHGEDGVWFAISPRGERVEIPA